ncbi:hypothetical protein Hdeb2414_s0008g00285061 [Helianthus debilis subsp. tardiflorus]
MNTVRIYEAKLTVSVAKFDKGHKRFNQNVERLGRQQMPPKSTPAPKKRWQPANVVQGMLYFDVVSGNGRRKQVSVVDEVGLYPKHCMGRAVIGEALNPKAMCYIKAMLNRGGHLNVAISYIGGLQLMLVFKESGEAKSFIANADLWQDFFASLALWEGQEVRDQHVACLKIEGVLLKLRDSDVFDRVGESFGRIVKSSDFSWTNADVSHGRCFVLTCQRQRIQEVIDLLWKGNRYQVGVTEVDDDWFSSLISSLVTPMAGSPMISVEPVIGEEEKLEEGEYRYSKEEPPVEVGRSGGGEAGGAESAPIGDNQQLLHGESMQPSPREVGTGATDLEGRVEEHAWGPTGSSIDLNKLGGSFSIGPNSNMEVDPPVRSRKRSRACRSPVALAQDSDSQPRLNIPVVDPCPSVVFNP